MGGGDAKKLQAVAKHRRRFAPLFNTLVTPLLNRLPSDGLIVEVGAGDGQFTDVLPPEVLQRTVAVEPMRYGVSALQKKHPSLRIEQAKAHQLPFADGTASAIIACCVFDVLPDLPAAIAEFDRALAPGGIVLHILDMATDLRALIVEIVEASNLCLLPNVFTDPTAAEWPEDLLVVPLGQLDVVIDVLDADPAARGLRLYRDAFRTTPEDAFVAFSALHESAEGRSGLSTAFRTAMSRASDADKRKLRRFEGRPLSSARMFHERLLDAGWRGFQIERSEIIRTSTTRALPLGTKGQAARSVVGFSQSGVFAGSAAANTELLELGVHVFHATKTNRSVR